MPLIWQIMRVHYRPAVCHSTRMNRPSELAVHWARRSLPMSFRHFVIVKVGRKVVDSKANLGSHINC